jgi:hypothetical protein
MSDSRFIKINRSEFSFIMDLLHEAGSRTDADGQPAFELHDDLLEQWARNDDEWGWGNDAANQNAENDFIDAGIRAREMMKQEQRPDIARPFADSDARTGSLAADRRKANIEREQLNRQLMRGTAPGFISNDPIDW